MKKLSFTLLASMLFLGAFAYHGDSKLKVKSWDNSSFTLVVNNQRIHSHGQFASTTVHPGHLDVQIYKRYSTPYSCGTIEREVYCGHIDIPRNSRIRATFRPNCGLTITSIKPIHDSHSCHHGHQFGHCSHGCNQGGGHGATHCSHGHQFGHCNHGCAVQVSTCNHGHAFGQCGHGCIEGGVHGNGHGGHGGHVDNGSGYGTGSNGQSGNGNWDGDYFDNVGNNHGGGHGNSGHGNGHVDNGSGYGTGHGNNYGSSYGQGMNSRAFRNLLYQVDNATFESDKLRVAKQAIRANGVSSAQVRDLMNTLTFDSSRLKLTKYAYQFVADRNNYYVVNDGFQFSSSSRELGRYINGNY